MKKTPPSSSQTELLGGSSLLEADSVMSGVQDIWINRGSAPEDSNVLVTLSNSSGEHTVLVTSDRVVDSSAKLFVTTPPERIVTKNDLRIQKLSVDGYLFGVIGYRNDEGSSSTHQFHVPNN
jgi:hypothetical protein